MTKGTKWTTFRIYKGDKLFYDYPVKVSYQYESRYDYDQHRYDIHSSIDMVEWPEHISSEDLESIKLQLTDMLDQILENDENDEWDTDDYWEQRLENN